MAVCGDHLQFARLRISGTNEVSRHGCYASHILADLLHTSLSLALSLVLLCAILGENSEIAKRVHDIRRDDVLVLLGPVHLVFGGDAPEDHERAHIAVARESDISEDIVADHEGAFGVKLVFGEDGVHHWFIGFADNRRFPLTLQREYQWGRQGAAAGIRCAVCRERLVLVCQEEMDIRVVAQVRVRLSEFLIV